MQHIQLKLDFTLKGLGQIPGVVSSVEARNICFQNKIILHIK